MSNQIVDELLKTRDQIMITLKSNLLDVQDRIKLQYDINRTKREFTVSDWVYFILQPYRHQTLWQVGKI